MTKEEKLQFIKQSYSMLEQLSNDICQRMAYAKEGIDEGNINLIMGSLSGIDGPAEHIRHIYEVMKYIQIRY